MKKILILILFLGAAGAAIYCGSHSFLKPEAARAALTPHYMDRVALALPDSFKVSGGTLGISCAGTTGLTRVYETPHQNYGLVAYEALSIMLPQGGPSRIIRDLSRDFGRPAQLVHTVLNQDEILTSIIADFETGSVRLTRTSPYNQAFSRDYNFIRETRAFMENYAWGHKDADSGAVHSLYGALGREDSPCERADFNLVFASEDEKIRLFISSDPDPARNAHFRGLEMAASAGGDSAPAWLSETLQIFKGRWNRKIRGGPRLLAGRPGLEWAAVRRDLSSGRTLFTAQWLPEAAAEGGPMPALVMNADLEEAPAALKIWDDILSSSALAIDFYR